MKNFKTKFIALNVVAISLFSSCDTKNSAKENNIKDEVSSLRNTFQNEFYIGAALDSSKIKENDKSITEFMGVEFGSITSENIMKSMFIHPQEDVFDYKLSDQFVALGEKLGQHIHGHTLIWHSQLSPWMEEINDRKKMDEVMKDHIVKITGRYKNRIDSWDVVNEALNEDGTYRETPFFKVLGEEYLAKAFAYAAETDPNAILFYNDYNLTKKSKREGVIKLVKSLQDKGVKIDGVGMQGHWSLNSPSLQEIEESIIEYSALGVEVAITELDITVLPNPWDLDGANVSENYESNPKMNPYPDSLPDSISIQLAERYKSIFELFVKHQDKISRVTFWGVNDGQSWLNNWPIKGRTNYPLLFDRDFEPKKAYYKVLSTKNN